MAQEDENVSCELSPKQDIDIILSKARGHCRRLSSVHTAEDSGPLPQVRIGQ